jgi:3'(2'),5'-bisphosphate nucleotidase
MTQARHCLPRRAVIEAAMPDSRAPAFDEQQRNEIARAFAQIALEASRPVMEIYASDFAARTKADASPVTEADERAEEVILARLATLVPELLVIAEEACARSEPPAAPGAFLLVDPVDGTREFVKRNDEFTINIALIDGRRPVAGAVYAPAKALMWFGGAAAARCNVGHLDKLVRANDASPIHTRKASPDALVAMLSRSHGDAATLALLDRLGVRERHAIGSSLKFCRLAEGRADIYPRRGPTNEWDTAAGEAVLRAGGGVVQAWDGGPFAYGKHEDRYRNGSFVACGDPAFAVSEEVLSARELSPRSR